MGKSVGGGVLCHIVCSQCCKLAQEAYSGVGDKSREVSDQRQRWGWRVWMRAGTQMKAGWNVMQREGWEIARVMWCKQGLHAPHIQKKRHLSKSVSCENIKYGTTSSADNMVKINSYFKSFSSSTVWILLVINYLNHFHYKLSEFLLSTAWIFFFFIINSHFFLLSTVWIPFIINSLLMSVNVKSEFLMSTCHKIWGILRSKVKIIKWLKNDIFGHISRTNWHKEDHLWNFASNSSEPATLRFVAIFFCTEWPWPRKYTCNEGRNATWMD